jgi:glycosyltransferase involved in cell wall biosynthesis
MTPELAALRERFPRVAISHEWLTIPGGSEKVVMRLLELFPRAEVYTSVYDPDPWAPAITERSVHASFLNRLPGATRFYPRLLPLMNMAFESFDLSGYDLVLSSNHACAKNVITQPGTLHLCYCHTPMRYAWDPDVLAGEQLGRVERVVLPLLLGRLRRQDAIASARPDAYVANSRHVAARIEKHYRREATVVHPPVDVARFLSVPRSADDYYLFVGRLVPYKRADLAVAACSILGRPLKVVGGGRAADALHDLAGPRVEFLGEITHAELARVLAGARAILFPGEEDFGMVPVEAQAAGVPVIAYGVGGALDSVIDGTTGLLFSEQTPEALADAILRFEAATLDEEAIRDNARRFSEERFDTELCSVLSELVPDMVAA